MVEEFRTHFFKKKRGNIWRKVHFVFFRLNHLNKTLGLLKYQSFSYILQHSASIFRLLKTIFDGFYHSKSPFFTSIWGIFCVFRTTLSKQI